MPFRNLACQIYVDQEQYQNVRNETVDHFIAHKSHFAEFETAIEERILEQKSDGFWGVNLEIDAISEVYIVGVIIWELSRTGDLVNHLIILHWQPQKV